MRAILLAVAGASLALAAAPAGAQPIVQTVEAHRNDRGNLDKTGDRFVHRPSGYVFPARLGDLSALRTISYGPVDSSIYYTLPNARPGDPGLSIYVYSRDLPLTKEAANTEAALLQVIPGTPVAAAGLPPLPPGAVERWFNGRLAGQEVFTGYRVAAWGTMFIKVRLTVAKDAAPDVMARTMRALAAVPWSAPQRVTASTAAVSPLFAR